MRRFTPLVVFTLLTGGCASPDGELAAMARERLALAPDVAWYKHSRDLPVYDPVRETGQLATLISAGQSAGLPADKVRRFFADEMEASRRVQWEWIHAWRKNLTPPPADSSRDLASELRPQIDEINRRQIDALARWAKPLSLAQLSTMGERFLPKKSLSSPAQSPASTPPVTSQR